MYQKERQNRIKHLNFFIVDVIGMQIAYVIAYMIRHGLNNPYEFSVYRTIGIFYAMIGICSLLFMDGYKNVLKRGYLTEINQVIIFVTSINLATSALLFMEKNLREFSRLVFIQTWIISILLLYLIRIVLKHIVKTNLRIIQDKRSVLLITSKYLVNQTIAKMLDCDYADFKITGIILMDDDMQGKKIRHIPIVGGLKDALDYVKSNVVDEVFINLPKEIELSEYYINKIIEMGITVHFNVMKLSDVNGNSIVEKFAGYTVITSSLKTATSKELFGKRVLDICGGIVGVILTGMVTLFVAPIILIQSPGPIFFSQERIGKNGRKFRIYKFRSMFVDAEAKKAELQERNEMQGLMFKMKDDPRIFPFGNFMRKYSIDELPQLYNVLRGEMSLVGTRPPTVDEYDQYEHHHRKRLATKPGLTGMWQVSGRSSITNFEDVVALDTKYIKNWSLFLDVKILFKTVGVVLGKKGAS